MGAFLAVFLCAHLCAGGPVSAEVPVPKLESRVTDLTDTLSADQRTALERKLADFEKRKGSQIAVLLVPSTEGEAIEAFSMRVAETWKIGRKGINDGVIIVVAKRDRRMRIEVGYGLEGALPDIICKRIIDEQMRPLFRSGEFSAGIDAAVDSIIKSVDGEPLPAPQSGDTLDPDHMGIGLTLGLIAFFSVFVIVGCLVPASINKLLCIFPIMAGVAGAVAGALLGKHWFFAMFGAAFVSFFVGVVTTVMSGFFLTIFGIVTGRSIAGVSSGSSGSWSSGSSSSGSGFSGGGGSFGGGGSSGSW